jgi:hypothetical protein
VRAMINKKIFLVAGVLALCLFLVGEQAFSQ